MIPNIMKFLYLTAGAAGMYCGSCMLDNALVRALIRRGEEAWLAPLYTPIRTDEEDVSLQRVFYGGINVYLQQKFAWARRLPSWFDSILNHPRLIRPLTANTGQTSPELLGSLAISMLKGTDGYQRKETLRLVDWISKEVGPDAVVFTNLLIGGCIPEVRRRIDASIFVTLQGDDIFLDHLCPEDRSACIQQMRKLVPKIDGFIVHSRDYGTRMSELFEIPDEKMNLIPLGIDVHEFVETESNSWMGSSNSNNDDEAIVIGYFARMAPEKGLDFLIDGFIELSRRIPSNQLKLRLAGWLGKHQDDYWKAQQSKLSQAGLDENWKYDGSVERRDKLRFFQSIDLLTVPTVYREPKGLFVLEAAAAGVPYLQPAHGAFPELHDRLNAGRLFPAGDMVAFVNELESLVRSLIIQGSKKDRRRRADQALLDEISVDRVAERFLQLPWKVSSR
jgi:glycosyltransferase involved in cell wall biosynthesis